VPYALFELCARRFADSPWWQWPPEYRDREPARLRRFARDNRAAMRGIWLEQYVFELQWSALKRYANERGVWLFGDLPFYMDRDSADVWWDRDCFLLDAAGRPEQVAGVPPDYFNAEGQLWGNPLYDGTTLARTGFAWWLERLDTQLARFDLLRIDHFRALESYWAVPASASTAREGHWCAGFGDGLLSRLAEQRGRLPLVAEDLGIITDDVRQLRDRYGLPGMAVLQFAFDGSPDNPHLPQNCGERTVIYTGTHDNDTTRGWLLGLDTATRDSVAATLGVSAPIELAALIEAIYASRAALAVVPMQDWLELGTQARMNLPGSVADNWRWRFDWSDVDADLPRRMRALTERYDRVATSVA
jgi:4-alpha-glucanotransferase